MAQFARPDSDLVAGEWVPTPLWQKLDEAVASDFDVISTPAGTGTSCELGLSDVTDPASSSGHVLRYRYRKTSTGGQSVGLAVELRQGAAVIGSWSHPISSTAFAAAAQTLSAGQADAITDYTDLRVVLVRNGDTGGNPNNRRSIAVSWVELEVPDAAPPPEVHEEAATTAAAGSGSATAATRRSIASSSAAIASEDVVPSSVRSSSAASSSVAGGSSSVIIGRLASVSVIAEAGGSALLEHLSLQEGHSISAAGAVVELDSRRDVEASSLAAAGGDATHTIGEESTELEIAGFTAAAASGSGSTSSARILEASSGATSGSSASSVSVEAGAIAGETRAVAGGSTTLYRLSLAASSTSATASSTATVQAVESGPTVGPGTIRRAARCHAPERRLTYTRAPRTIRTVEAIQQEDGG